MKRAIIFGASRGGLNALKHFKKSYEIIGFCDNDEKKVGQTMCGLEIFSPEQLLTKRYEIILISSMYKWEIRSQLLLLRIPSHKIEMVEDNIISAEIFAAYWIAVLVFYGVPASLAILAIYYFL